MAPATPMRARGTAAAEWKPSAFLSYATADGTHHAERLDRELRSSGVSTWLCARDMYRSGDFGAQLERAIAASDLLVACITTDVVSRPASYVRREIAFAEAYAKPIAVARFVDVVPPISVVNYTYFEFHLDWGAALGRLVEFCKQHAG